LRPIILVSNEESWQAGKREGVSVDEEEVMGASKNDARLRL